MIALAKSILPDHVPRAELISDPAAWPSSAPMAKTNGWARDGEYARVLAVMNQLELASAAELDLTTNVGFE
jgi:hypothetical protein